MGNSDKVNNRIKGVVVSVVLNGLLLLALMYIALPVVFPVPEEQGILIEFEEDKQPEPITELMGSENPVQVNDPGEQLEVAPPHVRPSNKTRAPKANNQPDAKPATAGDEGDVERYEPEKNKVNPRSLFQSSNSGTEELDNRTKLKDNSLFPGTGTSDDPTRGPNATAGTFTQEKGVGFSLAGRSVSGRLPLPEYKVQKEGKVVVEVTVDRDGRVVRANAILKGSTITDAQLLRAAEEAAKKSRFNSDGKAAVMQTGTITYHFRLQ